MAAVVAFPVAAAADTARLLGKRKELLSRPVLYAKTALSDPKRAVSCHDIPMQLDRRL